jgi:hypothetical protein
MFQVCHLEGQDSHTILTKGFITWLPLNPNEAVNMDKAIAVFKTVLDQK